MKRRTEQDFKIEEYEDFYEDHYFLETPDEAATEAHQHLPRVGWALDVAREINAKTVLDLGCLEGLCILTLAKQAGMSGVGVDLSKDGIELGLRRAKDHQLPVAFYQMTLEKYLEKSVNKGEKFDLVVLFEVMEHVKNPELVFELASKVLTDKGELLVSTPDFEAPTFGKDDEQNKCHIRLFTTADDDYEAENRYGHVRKATSLSKMVGKDRIKSMDVWSELIHSRIK